ncbi:MAG TPA: cache domain-containing protein [Planctomycetota bacterium]
MLMLTRGLTSRSRSIARPLGIVAIVAALFVCTGGAQEGAAKGLGQQPYEHRETRELVALVDDAAKMIESKGEAALAEFRVPGSRWRHEETYIFVLDPEGNMLVHPDPTVEGKNQLALKDVNGRLIVKGLLDAATSLPDKKQGWYHYEWQVPGGLLPRWKSSYVRHTAAPSGERFVVGSGIYNDRMERAFVVDMVEDAIGRVEKQGEAAFALFRDRTGSFLAKDAYVFVIDPNGVDLVNPAFPNLEGRTVLDVKDTQGKRLIREMLDVAKAKGRGWVEYMWPKPGDSVSTQKSAYVGKADVGGKWCLVGCGVYLADAPKAAPIAGKMTASQFMSLVREAAAVFEQRGEKAYPEFRTEGSKWLHDDTYFFTWTLDGTRIFHAVDPTLEGRNGTEAKDVLGRPYGRMFLEVAARPSGEGWVHYMYPEPGDMFPAWKSVFVKRVNSPSGKQHLIGAGNYNMQMDKALVQDVVDRAAALVADRGTAAFALLRDKTGPFVFMDTYVFVTTIDGVELVNPAQPSLEGTNLLDLRDLNGKSVIRECIAAATKEGAGWVEYSWYRPGSNTPSRKLTYVRRVQAGEDTLIVGSGVYLDP